MTAKIATMEAEQKRRIEAEEDKARLSVQLEGARSVQSISTGSGDSSDLDTYRVSSPKQGCLILSENC